MKRSVYQKTHPVILAGRLPYVSDAFDIDTGKVVSLPPQALRNPYRTPILVDEIRWTSGFSPNTGLELKIGNVYLTRGFVPYCIFGNRLSSPFAQGAQTWRLPTPLFLCPGEEVTARFALNNDGYIPGMGIALAGRALDDCVSYPDTISVPYITYYRGPLNAQGANYIDDTSVTDLVNPFETPMRAQRFLGCVLQGATSGITNNLPENESLTSSALIGFGDNTTENAYYTVSMVDHLANPTVRNATTWASVFSSIDRSWLINTTLPPKGYYLATINAALSTAPSGQSYQALIGLIGTREVRLA